MTAQWEASGDLLTALGTTIRSRASNGWKLHSWNIFTQMEGGGRITPYPVEMFYAVWKREP